MKRSVIDKSIKDALFLLKQNNVTLPFFGYMTLNDWKKSSIDYSQLRDSMLGWDITDFGSNDFIRTGASLFTARNGNLHNRTGTPYAEKYIILNSEHQQQIPMHYHISKTEDIINRAGGNLMIQVYNSRPDGSLDDKTSVILYMDGVRTVCKPGEIVKVSKGNSVTLTPFVYHRFFAEKNCGDVIIGEVSSINDDNTDNVFLEKADRFSTIIEDAPAEYVLVKEYDRIAGIV